MKEAGPQDPKHTVRAVCYGPATIGSPTPNSTMSSIQAYTVWYGEYLGDLPDTSLITRRDINPGPYRPGPAKRAFHIDFADYGQAQRLVHALNHYSIGGGAFRQPDGPLTTADRMAAIATFIYDTGDLPGPPGANTSSESADNLTSGSIYGVPWRSGNDYALLMLSMRSLPFCLTALNRGGDLLVADATNLARFIGGTGLVLVRSGARNATAPQAPPLE